MSERPIPFSGPMVRAILDGRKTQTRRVIKPQPEQRADGWHVETKPASGYGSEKLMRDFLPIYCPYGQPGDRLWVRETWLQNAFDQLLYKADMEGYETRGMGWKSSRFMPRWASRLTLEITGVRVERVQDISEADAIAEGVMATEAGDGYPWKMPARMNFVDLWDEINAKRGYGWESDPWVWCISFRRVDV